MAEQPKEVCDVEVVLRGDYAGGNEAALDRLRGVGLKVVNVIGDEGVVEGTLPAERLDALQKLDCVAYVRNVFTYIASAGDDDAGQPRRAP